MGYGQGLGVLVQPQAAVKEGRQPGQAQGSPGNSAGCLGLLTAPQ